MSGVEVAVATLESSLESALALGEQALLLAESGRVALLSACFEADALVLGALQLESSLRARSPARFEVASARRRSTGTEAQLAGKVVYHALGLPAVSALFPDATSRTLLNRNLRAILRGYAAAGIPLRYFGTEVLALLGHPVGLVGYDQTASGAVLLEILIGLEQPCVVRSALAREPPAALYALLRSEPDARDLLSRAVAGVVARLDARALDVEGRLASAPPPPQLEALEVHAALKVPLGVVEACASPSIRVFGDLLVSRAALHEVEVAARAAVARGAGPDAAVLEPLEGAALDGARPGDILAVLDRALAGRVRA